MIEKSEIIIMDFQCVKLDIQELPYTQVNVIFEIVILK